MSKVLILAEKPSLAQKIAGAIDKKMKRGKTGFYENDEVIVANLVGHVLKRKIPKPFWNIDNLPGNYDNLPYEVIPDKKSLVSSLLNSIKRSDVHEICSAGDPDAEGSLLVKELLDYSEIESKSPNMKFSRMWILSYNPKSIKDSYDDRYDLIEDKPWSDAADARGFADLYVGYNLSPLFSLISNKQYAIGRVMTPTINLVRKRELEIENFVSKQYFLINGMFNKGDINFNTKYVCKENNNTEKIPPEHIEPSLTKLENKTFVIKENKTKPKRTNPDFLPNLNDVLKSMSKRFKMKAVTVTKEMQFLYENQFCSYPRSEQKFLPPDMASTFEEIFNTYNSTEEFNDFEATFDSTNTRIFDAEKSNPHYAITPLSKSQTAIEGLSANQRKIFDFIKGQFMMSFMPPYLYEETIILLENSDGATFKISGKIEKQKGFKAYQSKNSNEKKKKDEVVLPDVQEGEEIELKSFKKEEKWTEPPKLLKEGDLLSYMENINKIYINEMEDSDEEETDEEIFKEKFSLGTPATRGPTIEKIYKKEYLILTKDGLITNQVAKDMLVDIKDSVGIEMTANFEKDMGKITEGKLDSNIFINDIKKYVDGIILQNKDRYVPKPKAEPTGENCPKCSKELVQKEGKFGKFVYCSGYPKCEYVKQDEVGRDCPKCSSALVKKKGKNGDFVACSNYPKCKFIENSFKEVGRDCPKCSNALVEKKGKNGVFVACSNYPDCKFIEGSSGKAEDSGEKCEKCEKPMLVKSGKNGKFLACSGYPDCKNTKPYTEK